MSAVHSPARNMIYCPTVNGFPIFGLEKELSFIECSDNSYSQKIQETFQKYIDTNPKLTFTLSSLRWRFTMSSDPSQTPRLIHLKFDSAEQAREVYSHLENQLNYGSKTPRRPSSIADNWENILRKLEKMAIARKKEATIFKDDSP